MRDLGVESCRVGCFVGGSCRPNGLGWRNFVGLSGTEKLGLANMTHGSAARIDYLRGSVGIPGSSEGLRGRD